MQTGEERGHARRRGHAREPGHRPQRPVCRSGAPFFHQFGGSYFDAGERYLKLAFKAQNQCRMTLETLTTIKNPPVVYAKQANIAHGPQQVNNSESTSAPRTDSRNSAGKHLEPELGPPSETSVAADAFSLDCINDTRCRERM